MHLETVRLKQFPLWEVILFKWKSFRDVAVEWLLCFSVPTSEMRMRCRKYIRLSSSSWNLALKWIQSLTAAGTTGAGSQLVYLNRTGPESWVCVIAAWVLTTATVSKKVLLSIELCTSLLHFLLISGDVLSFLPQSTAGIIVGWLWRCQGCLWRRSWSSLTVS